jgi:CheY-specific phosphatase CheX
MPANSTFEIQMDELTQIVQDIFATMLCLEVSKSGQSWKPDGDRLTATIHLAGQWRGALALECEYKQACSFAARFLSMSPPEIVDDAVHDVLGELLNMIGGNLKYVLAGGLKLCLPSVVNGDDRRLRVCRAGVKERLVFDCAEGLFAIAVLREERRSVRVP